jgi:hypothetical protein
MPANFGEIAGYHGRMAERYLALAKAAREAGDLYAADYNDQLAARYVEAAEEQKMVMSQAPGRPVVNQAPRPWAQEQTRTAKPAPKPTPKPALNTALKTSPKLAARSTPLAVTCFSAIRRGAGILATAFQQSLSSANASFQGLSLQDSPPTHAPGLRG